MRIIMLGPPGVGKGTQGKMLAQTLNVPRIATGDILRQAVRDMTDLGSRASFYVERGELVPDAIVIGVVVSRLLETDAQKGFLLDGFPRTVGQAQELDSLLEEIKKPLQAALLLEASNEVLLERITGRRVCRDCEAIYHIRNSPPQREGICDRCGGEVYQREDDAEGTVRYRLEVHERRTRPLRDYYRRRGILHRINAEQDRYRVHDDICQALGEECHDNSKVPPGN